MSQVDSTAGPSFPPGGGDPRAQAEWLRVALASIGDAVISTDAAGRVTFMNGVAESLTGWPLAEAAARPLTDVFRIVNEHTRQTVENPVERALREGAVVGLANHTILIAKDGRESPIDDSAAPMRDAAGAILGVILVFRDVTERKRAEAQRAMLAAIVESSEDAIVSKTLQGVIRSWNAAAERVFGYTAAEAIGQPITLLIPPERRDEEPAILERLKRGERVEHFETVRVAKDGRRLDISLTISPIRDDEGQIIGASKVARDITESKQSVTKLQAAEERLRKLADNLPSGFIYQVLHTPENHRRFTYVSAGVEPLCGIPPEEVLAEAMTLYSQVAPEDLPTVFAAEEAALREFKPFDCRFRIQTRHGQTRWLHCRSAPHRVADGVVWDGIALDVTERQRAVEALAASRETQQFLSQIGAVLAGSLDYRQTLASVAGLCVPRLADWCAVDVLEPDGVLRRLAVMHADPEKVRWAAAIQDQYPADPHAPHGVHQVIRSGQSELYPQVSDEQLRQAAKDEEHLTILRQVGIGSAMIVPLTARGQTLGAITLVAAESHRTFGPAELALAEEVGRRAGLATDNARLFGEVVAADRRKDDFIALLAHELRNPLAPLRNGLEIMRLAKHDPQAIAQVQGMMDRQLSHMVRLIDDLLDVARISRNKMELRRERVRLEDVIQNAIETARPLLQDAGHELTVSLPPGPTLLDGDLTRLAQVFGNLLTNSAKYTKHGGQVSVTGMREGQEVSVLVRDNGIGIPPAALPRIFDMFAQVDRNLERSAGGLGIGLALVKGLVEMHGGSIRAESEGEGKGSAFTVVLPVAESRLGAPIASGSGAATAGRTLPRKILVADDNPDVATSMATMLRLLGDEVVIAHDGLEAVELAERSRPELVLMDVGMPHLNGYDAVRRIRAHDWGREMTILAITGWGQESDRRQSLSAGCDGHLVKPVRLSDLEQALAQLREAKR